MTFFRFAICVALLADSLSAVFADEHAPRAPVPEGAFDRLGSLRLQCGGHLARLDWSDDGERLFTKSVDRFCVWNSRTGELLNRVSLVSKRNVAFDGERLLLIGDATRNGVSTQTFRVVDGFTGKDVSTFSMGSWCHNLALFRGGQRAVIVTNWRVHLVDTQTGEIVDSLPPFDDKNNRAVYPSIELSRDNRLLTVRTSDQRIRRYAITPDGHFGETLKPLETKDRDQFDTLTNRLLVWGKSSTQLWNPLTEQFESEIPHETIYSVQGHSLSHDGRFMAMYRVEGWLRVWDIPANRLLVEFKTHGHYLSRMSWSPDGKWLAAADDARVRIWNTTTWEEILFDAAHEMRDQIASVAISDDGAFIAAAEQLGVVSAWKLGVVPERTQFTDGDRVHGGNDSYHRGTQYLAFRPGTNELVMGNLNQPPGVDVWDVEQNKPVKSWTTGDRDRVECVVWHPAGQQLITQARGNAASVWNAEGNRICQFYVATGWRYPLAVLPTETLRILIPIAQTRPKPNRRRDDDEGVESVYGIQRIDAVGKPIVDADGKPIAKYLGHQQPVKSITVSRDGKLLATAAYDGTIRIWATHSERCLHVLEADEPAPHGYGNDKGHACVAFSPTSDLLASAGIDGRVHLWNPATGQHQSSAVGHDGRIRCLAWRRDGSVLVSGGEDATIIVWDANKLVKDD